MASKNIALLFPGQGAQAPGMGKDLYDKFQEARDILDAANTALGFDLTAKIFSGTEEELKETSVTQPAIFSVSCAAYRTLLSRAPGLQDRVAFAAGHSLGEYAALFSAQVFDFQTGIKLIEYRGKFIQEACQKAPGTMAAVIGVERAELEKICGEAASGGAVCQMVNFNCPGQIVIAGGRDAVLAASAKAAALPGAKAVPLSVSGAFHSSLMNEASVKMAAVLGKADLKSTAVPVFTNSDATATKDAESFRTKLASQIDHPVLWEDSIRGMIAGGADTFIEIGPGRVLSGLLRRIDKKMKALNVEDEASLNKTLASLGL